MTKNLLLFYFILFLNIPIFSQTKEIDSLKVLLNNTIKNDTVKVNILNKLSRAITNSNIEDCLKYAKEANELSVSLKYKEGESESLRLLGVYFDEKSDYKTSFEYFNKALAIQNKLNNKTSRAKIYNDLGISFFYQGKFQQALDYYEKALKIRIDINDQDGIASVYNNLGIVHNEQSNFEKALDYYHKSVKIRQEMGDSLKLARPYNNIGGIFRVTGDHYKAIEYFQKSLVIMEMLNDKRGMSSCYNNIGIVFRTLGENEKAIEYYRKALEYDENPRNVAIFYNNIANIYSDMKDYDKALEYNIVSLKIREEIGEKAGLASSYENTGSVYTMMGKKDLALEYLNKALNLSIEIGAKQTQALIYNSLSNLYLKENRLQNALEYGKKAFDLANISGEIELIKNSSNLLSQTTAKLGLYKEAYNYQVIFKQMSDSLINQENTKKILSREFEFKNQKEKELIKIEQEKRDALLNGEINYQKKLRNYFVFGFLIVLVLLALLIFYYKNKQKISRLLKAKQLEIEVKNKELIQLNADKDRFLQILAHDLRSPFTTLMGFTDIILESLSKKQYEEIKEPILIIDKVLKKTFNLFEDLLLWSKSQQGKLPFNPIKFTFSKIVVDCLNKTNSKNIAISYSENEIIDVFADINMIKTVLRNLVSNAIKFSHQGSSIRIVAKKQENLAIISVSDQGVGIAKEDLDKLWNITQQYTTPGTEGERGTGLGLLLCREFIEKNGGKIWVESIPNKGSDFYFTIPLD